MATPDPGRKRFAEPELETSADLRKYCESMRKDCHEVAMLLHIAAAEVRAVLEPIGEESGLFSKSIRRRRANRVAKQLEYAAECIVQAGAASVRTWATFRVEYRAELTPNSVRGRRRTLKVVPE